MLLVVPIGIVTGFGFAAFGVLIAAVAKTIDNFNYVTSAVLTPMFLVAGTFFPISSLPQGLRTIAQFNPLYHCVALVRDVSLNTMVSRGLPARRGAPGVRRADVAPGGLAAGVAPDRLTPSLHARSHNRQRPPPAGDPAERAGSSSTWRRSAWTTLPQRGTWCMFEAPDAPSPMLGIGVHILPPGERPGYYHAESEQEGFLVLSGECIAIVEGEERRLRAWDYLHCPPGTRHITVGAGDEPCAILMVGTRTPAMRSNIRWSPPRPATVPR